MGFYPVARQSHIRIEKLDDFPVTAVSSLLTWISTCRTLQNMIRMMLKLVIVIIRAVIMDRADLVIENAALRQQLAIFKDKHPRPSLQSGIRRPGFLDSSTLDMVMRALSPYLA
jgi:hypothetical protein